MKITIPDHMAHMCAGSLITIAIGAASYFLWKRQRISPPETKSVKKKENQEEKEPQKEDHPQQSQRQQSKSNEVEEAIHEEQAHFGESGSSKMGDLRHSHRDTPLDDPPDYAEIYPQGAGRAFQDKHSNGHMVEHNERDEKNSDNNTEGKEFNQVAEENLEEDETEQDNENNPAEAEKNAIKAQAKMPETFIESPFEKATFVVDDKGLLVRSPYCKLHFPPGATKNKVLMEMIPDYECHHAIPAGQISISPTVNFSSEQKMVFDKKVTVEIHTNYTAVEKTVPVQIMWREDSESPFKKFKQIRHGNKRFLSFTTKHFCGYTAHLEENQREYTQRHYYSAMYKRKSSRRCDQILHWMIYDDCPHITHERLTYCKEKSMVVDPELFNVKFGFNLQLSLISQDIRVLQNNQSIRLLDKWGSGVNESFQFMAKIQEREESDEEVSYQLLAINPRNQAVLEVTKKPFFMNWQEELPQAQTSVVTVTGDQAVGVMNNYGDDACRLMLQQQMSDVSNASSGYSSDGVGPSTVGHSVSLESVEECPDDQLLSETQEPYTLDQSASSDFGFSSAPPDAQSTPRSTIVEDETRPKDEEELPNTNDKSFA